MGEGNSRHWEAVKVSWARDASGSNERECESGRVAHRSRRSKAVPFMPRDLIGGFRQGSLIDLLLPFVVWSADQVQCSPLT